MSGAPHKEILRNANAFFRELAAVLRSARYYAPSHPRFRRAADRVIGLLQKWFTRPDAPALEFLVDEQGEVEFHSMPLGDVGIAGAELARSMAIAGVHGIVLEPNLEVESLVHLARSLERGMSREAQNDASSGAESTDASNSGPPAFRVLSREDRRRLLARGSGGHSKVDDLVRLVVPEGTIESMIEHLRQAFHRLASSGVVEVGLVRQAIDRAIEIAREGKSVAASTCRSYFDDFTFYHSVNVALLATDLAALVLDDHGRIAQIATAALLHDTGKTLIPKDILHKPGKLTASERDLMETHTLLGAEALLETSEIDPVCVSAAFTHHMHPAAGSYPHTSFPVELSGFHRLLGVVDVYEALTAPRPYKPGMSSRRAFEIMLGMPGLADRVPLIQLLYERVGPYPVGSVVELGTGERGIVVAHDPSCPTAPRVRLLRDRDGRRLDEKIEVELFRPEFEIAREKIRAVLPQSAEEDPLEAEPEPVTNGRASPPKLFGEPIVADGVLMSREG